MLDEAFYELVGKKVRQLGKDEWLYQTQAGKTFADNEQRAWLDQLDFTRGFAKTPRGELVLPKEPLKLDALLKRALEQQAFYSNPLNYEHPDGDILQVKVAPHLPFDGWHVVPFSPHQFWSHWEKCKNSFNALINGPTYGKYIKLHKEYKGCVVPVTNDGWNAAEIDAYKINEGNGYYTLMKGDVQYSVPIKKVI